MKMITRKEFIGGMAATVALGWRGAFAAPGGTADARGNEHG